MKLKYLVSAVVAIAALAGCSPAPSIAVIVDGKSYLREDVIRGVASCTSLLDLPESTLSEAEAARFIAIGGVISELEAATSPIEPEVLNSALAAVSPLAPLEAVQNEECAPILMGVAKLFVVKQARLSKYLRLAAQDTQVVLNPMYGALAVEGNSLVKSASLSAPASK